LSVLMCRIVDSMFWACWLAARRSACSMSQDSSTRTVGFNCVVSAGWCVSTHGKFRLLLSQWTTTCAYSA
jgi:hypothetical protein